MTTPMVSAPTGLGDLGHHRGGTRAGPAALAGGDEDHVGTLERLFDLAPVLLGRLATDLGVAPGPEPPGELATDVELQVGVAHEQRLGVGVHGDELDALQTGLDHAVHRVDAAAADAHDLDDSEVAALRWTGHRLSSTLPGVRASPVGTSARWSGWTTGPSTSDLTLDHNFRSWCLPRWPHPRAATANRSSRAIGCTRWPKTRSAVLVTPSVPVGGRPAHGGLGRGRYVDHGAGGDRVGPGEHARRGPSSFGRAGAVGGPRRGREPAAPRSARTWPRQPRSRPRPRHPPAERTRQGGGQRQHRAGPRRAAGPSPAARDRPGRPAPAGPGGVGLRGQHPARCRRPAPIAAVTGRSATRAATRSVTVTVTPSGQCRVTAACATQGSASTRAAAAAPGSTSTSGGCPIRPAAASTGRRPCARRRPP